MAALAPMPQIDQNYSVSTAFESDQTRVALKAWAPGKRHEPREDHKPPAVCLLALLEQWLQSSVGAAHTNYGGFVCLHDVLGSCASLRGLTGNSTSVLAEAARSCPAEGPVEFDPEHCAVRLRGLRERVRTAVGRHAAELGEANIMGLLHEGPVAAALSCIPASERLRVLQDALAGPAPLPWHAPPVAPHMGHWYPAPSVPACGRNLGPSALSAEAPVFVPSWERPGAAAAKPSYRCTQDSLDCTERREAQAIQEASKIAENLDRGCGESLDAETAKQGPGRTESPSAKAADQSKSPEATWDVPAGMVTGAVQEAPDCAKDVGADVEEAPDCAKDVGADVEEGTTPLARTGSGDVSEPDSEPEAETVPAHVDEATSPTAEEATSCATYIVGLSVWELLRWRTAAEAPPSGQAVLGLSASSINDMAAGASPSSQAALGRSASGVMKERRTAGATHGKGSEGSTPGIFAGSGSAAAAAGAKNPTAGEASATSWVARQRLRHSGTDLSVDGDDSEEIARKVKSILNKLTVEKFPELSQKLLAFGVRTENHVELLIQEIFEKATTQHHFIDMYADLCVVLHEFFVEHPVNGDPKPIFKRLLLNQCQATFEENLAPPSELAELEQEERIIHEIRYKRVMIGNIRFVGALLTRRLLPSKVMRAVVMELLGEPTPESLEAAAALLAAVGPTFDAPESGFRPTFNCFFARIKDIVSSTSCEPRARCLLKDVIELRACGWQSCRPQRQELPTSLQEVAERRTAEERGGAPVAGPRPQAPLLVATPCRSVPRAPCFDQAKYRDEVQKALAELRVTHDAAEAAARVVAVGVPPLQQQPSELAELLAHLVQEGAADVRKAGFVAVAKLFADGHWSRDALHGGLALFSSTTCEYLRVDVPGLDSILQEELTPKFETLCAA